MYVAKMVCKTAKWGVREWCPSITGRLLPTMADSLLAPGSVRFMPPPKGKTSWAKGSTRARAQSAHPHRFFQAHQHHLCRQC